MSMSREEFNRRMQQIEIDHATAIALVSASDAKGDRFTELWNAARESFIQSSLSLQREAGIPTPVCAGRTE